MKKIPLRIIYAAGPGDIIGTYRYWKKKQEDPSIPGLTDSGQFYDLVQELGDIKALVVSSCPCKDLVNEAPFTLKHIPKKQRSGLFYHISQVTYGLRICFEAICFKASIAVIEEGTSHWFVWNLLYLFNIEVIPSLKCTLWPEFQPLSFKQKVLNYIDRSFFKKKVKAILSMSGVINQQIATLTNFKHPPIFNFLPIYQRKMFDNILLPNPQQRPFNILYIGRIETCKGVFDVLEIAKIFRKKKLEEIKFIFCGQGSSYEELSSKIISYNLTEVCRLEGYCDREKLKKNLEKSHVVIVPSRTSFGEGYCMVVVEGVLAGRPVITSKVCPALYDVLPAVCETEPDHFESYAAAILELYSSPNFYQIKQKACSQVSEPFYDINNAWKVALKKAILIS
jgi:glycogen synthase